MKAKERSVSVGQNLPIKVHKSKHEEEYSNSALFSSRNKNENNICVFCHLTNHTPSKCLKLFNLVLYQFGKCN